MRRRTFVGGLVAAGAFAGSAAQAQAGPLASWQDGPVKRRLLDFVTRTTTPGSADWVPVPERIATFDNDGTLWTEQPIYVQVQFALERLRVAVAQHPEWRDREPFRSVLADDRAQLALLGEKGVLDVVTASHAGLTTEEYRRIVVDWLASARHPRFDRPYTDLVYQPMLELLAWLRAHQFKTFIVSGGGIDFMRAFTETVYGIPPEQIVGSSGITRYQRTGSGAPVLIKEDRVAFIDDGPGKAEGIDRFIGRRPVLAFGNSDGDLQMLEWTAAGPGLRLMGLVHHTDAVREYAYDRQSSVGRLDRAWDEALRRDWLVVDMKRDWKVVFPFELR